ncbi:hypothetical protein K438DRAFT_680835 [Mycena galopus ATCC 62051]|nr:hypothetical protein K438DRAFT_680835 [Mycena galopus ATCC 62051]
MGSRRPVNTDRWRLGCPPPRTFTVLATGIRPRPFNGLERFECPGTHTDLLARVLVRRGLDDAFR